MQHPKIIKKVKLDNGVLLYIVKALRETRDYNQNPWAYYIVRHCKKGIKTLKRTNNPDKARLDLKALINISRKTQDQNILPIGNQNRLFKPSLD